MANGLGDRVHHRSKTHRLGVVIVTHNSREALEGCLNHLLSAGPTHSPASIWVVDSGSDAEQVPADQRIDRIIRAANYGYGSSVNIAVGAGLESDWLIVVNPDAMVTLQQIEELVEIAEAEGADIIAPSLDQSSEHGGHFTSTPHPPWARRTSVSGSELGRDDRPRTIGVASVHGSVMLISQEAFRILGGFDERFFLYFEEIDLCVRASQNGLRVAYSPDVEAAHAGGASSEGVTRIWRRTEMMRGKVRFFRKHFGRTPTALMMVDEFFRHGKDAIPVFTQLRHKPRRGLAFPARPIDTSGHTQTCAEPRGEDT
ncbi:glycosyltransferase family 2 protein [Microbacterium sp. PM5]|uniref:glycosyltransferase family 2 protein n=1 Tax=Microbacterium sp. PM5 TaxID=2014534 RepID=UPI000DD13146|nr:glycosyltransferase family 2 protein [Microbacterium sp. PM5]AXA97133.1 hypothetical protein CEP17_12340 [Microbacterium sp. PM5]